MCRLRLPLVSFLAPALAMFADQDRNGDGVLTADELRALLQEQPTVERD